MITSFPPHLFAYFWLFASNSWFLPIFRRFKLSGVDSIHTYFIERSIVGSQRLMWTLTQIHYTYNFYIHFSHPHYQWLTMISCWSSAGQCMLQYCQWSVGNNIWKSEVHVCTNFCQIKLEGVNYRIKISNLWNVATQLPDFPTF